MKYIIISYSLQHIQGCITEKLPPPHPKEKKIKYKIFAIHENWTHKFKEYSTFTDVCTCMYFDYQEAD